MEQAHIEEYRAVMENYAQLAMRRQNLNTLFVGLNAFFLTGIGFLLLESHFNAWLLVCEVGAITVAIFPMNVLWLRALARYRFMIEVHSDYLKHMEQESKRELTDRSADNTSTGTYPGIISAMDARAKQSHYGTSSLEWSLAFYFVLLYPLLTLLIAALTYMIVVLHLLKPIAHI